MLVEELFGAVEVGMSDDGGRSLLRRDDEAVDERGDGGMRIVVNGKPVWVRVGTAM